MNFGIWCILASASICAAEKWQWPEQAASVRIDTKVRFLDGNTRDKYRGTDEDGGRGGTEQADEVPFHEAAETDGFYNRPPGAGRYPVRVETHPYRVDGHAIYPMQTLRKNYYSDGTLDSLQYCKCVDSPDCNPHPDSARACGSGKFLCCFKRPNKVTSQNTEYFNEIDDERPSLLPGREGLARPFPPPPHAGLDGTFGPGHGHETALIGAADRTMSGPARPGVLVGPGGPSGVIGPIGLDQSGKRQPEVLVGPEGPTGVIGPAPVNNRNNIVIGPGGPRDISPSESAQRGILVGPGGPTGIIGPRAYGQRPVLVGPGGPTGIIGPRGQGYRGRFYNQFGGRQTGPGVLVGPGGPTGVIGPGRAILTGPGGPTGVIGPY